MELTKAIITAMKEEADLIIKKFDLKLVKELKNISIYEWERESEEWKEKLVLAVSGIWKTQSTIATTHLCENYIIDKLVNIWIAWNLWDDDVKVWDVFMPNTFIQHDMYLPFDGPHLDYAKKPIFLEYAIWENYDLTKFWLILNWVCLTWDQFIDDDKKVNELRLKFGADLCEMEAFSVLSVAREYDILDKCVVIKAVSDGADSDAKDAHMDNLVFAMENSIAVLDFIL